MMDVVATKYGNSKSCGKCSFKSKEYWLSQTWGKLRLDPEQELPEEWNLSSNKKFTFKCACGRSCNCKFQSATNGNSKSCGKCSFKPKGYWLLQQWGDLKLDPSQDLPEEWPPQSALNLYFYALVGKQLT